MSLTMEGVGRRRTGFDDPPLYVSMSAKKKDLEIEDDLAKGRICQGSIEFTRMRRIADA